MVVNLLDTQALVFSLLSVKLPNTEHILVRLQLCWLKKTEMFTREFEVGAQNKIILIDQKLEGDTGVVVWDAALVLAKYLELCDVSGKTVVELGSGTGFVGLAAAALGIKKNKLGGSVILSDLEENLDLLNHNINKNKAVCEKIKAKVLKWGDRKAVQEILQGIKVDFLLVADCVYYTESIEDLVNTLLELSNSTTQLLVSYEDRDSTAKIELQNKFSSLMNHHFNSSEVPLHNQHTNFRSFDIHIFIYTLKH
ncbi:protein-lysine methyltransferase METTL21D isoform X1 [Eurytemora carolleeae]|uniref:protein-lysine methyltransferase METTL21D isoform X1 n=1 Tax=Eurytemora carolleeae TaxID=1294199 RepID=UPI000C75F459|nr:protein-lysine methyltransferase METTL21D isoform X1 [Eurytemora carolleeae]|eukprot:XP_023319490.1 protein-lysine methyltransferase METTL21D-like isoform X1 [Eurytemora affinis]